MNITFKRLQDITFAEATEIWNQGFEGYFIQITMTVDSFLQRMALEGLSPAISVVAYVDGEPAGIVLNGVRHVNRKSRGMAEQE